MGFSFMYRVGVGFSVSLLSRDSFINSLSLKEIYHIATDNSSFS